MSERNEQAEGDGGFSFAFRLRIVSIMVSLGSGFGYLCEVFEMSMGNLKYFSLSLVYLVHRLPVMYFTHHGSWGTENDIPLVSSLIVNDACDGRRLIWKPGRKTRQRGGITKSLLDTGPVCGVMVRDIWKTRRRLLPRS